MALSTYSDILQSISDHLDRPDLDSFRGDFFTIGENRVYRELRIRAMETAYSANISSGVAAVPSDYVELKHAYVNTAPIRHLERTTPERILKSYPQRSAQGKPAFISREGSNFIFGPYPDSSYTILGIYYKRFTALSTSNETNWFTTNAPEILLYAGLCAAEKFTGNDERVALFNGLFNQLKEDIHNEEWNEQASGSSLSAVAY